MACHTSLTLFEAGKQHYYNLPPLQFESRLQGTGFQNRFTCFSLSRFINIQSVTTALKVRRICPGDSLKQIMKGSVCEEPAH
jgi:hypothetical protein